MKGVVRQHKGRYRFSRDLRLRHRSDFDRVHGGNIHAADGTLVVLGSKNNTSTCRLGLSISRRVGNAVVRNRWKRLIREAFRQQRAALPRGLDLVVRPRRGAEGSFTAISASLPRLAKRVERRVRRMD
ncbi:MAG: ribonuclease P protein component [Planctomycetota bacterium]